MRPIHTTAATIISVPDLKQRIPDLLPGPYKTIFIPFSRIANTNREPRIRLAVPHVIRLAFLKGGIDGRVEELHSSRSIGSERNARSDLAEMGCRFIDCEGDVVLEEGDCESEAGYAAADYGEIEGFWGLQGGRSSHCEIYPRGIEIRDEILSLWW